MDWLKQSSIYIGTKLVFSIDEFEICTALVLSIDEF